MQRFCWKAARSPAREWVPGRPFIWMPTATLEAFPAGGVLVARRSSPKFVRLMTKAKAIVTDAGSTTGHMASLARELRVPTLLNTKTATRAIPPGQLVTVDAGNGYVYAGEVPSLLARQLDVQEGQTEGVGARMTAELEFLAKALAHMAPLNLTDPRAATFAPDHCRSLHDLARFIHEKSYEVMFGLGDQLGDFRAASYQLDVYLPIDLFIIDLGGGFKGTPKGQKVKPAQVASGPHAGGPERHARQAHPPLRRAAHGHARAVLGHDAPRHHQPRGAELVPGPLLRPDLGLLRELLGPGGLPLQRARCLLLPHPEQKLHQPAVPGGAADNLRRSRRTLAIANILKHYGFATTLNADVVIGRLNKGSLEETTVQLEMIGRLLQFFRQMDAAMATDDHARMIENAFLTGDYALSVMTGEKKEGGGEGNRAGEAGNCLRYLDPDKWNQEFEIRSTKFETNAENPNDQNRNQV